MNEEEIIKEFKELIYNPDYDEILLCTEDGFTGWHELFKNILDLYNKEKEKNEILEDTLNNSIDIRKYWISKDKIKEKIKYIEENYSEHSGFPIGKSIEFLQELLEERN